MGAGNGYIGIQQWLGGGCDCIMRSMENIPQQFPEIDRAVQQKGESHTSTLGLMHA